MQLFPASYKTAEHFHDVAGHLIKKSGTFGMSASVCVIVCLRAVSYVCVWYRTSLYSSVSVCVSGWTVVSAVSTLYPVASSYPSRCV